MSVEACFESNNNARFPLLASSIVKQDVLAVDPNESCNERLKLRYQGMV